MDASATPKTPWLRIAAIWALSAISAVVAVSVFHRDQAFAWFGAVLAGSLALVSLVHLVRASKTGFVKELIYVGGGTYLILALISVYLFFAG